MENLNAELLLLVNRFEKAIIRVPTIAGNTAVNFALDNWKRQGFLGATFQPWRMRKDPTKWKQHPKRPGRAILVLTGRLRQSIRIVSTSTDQVIVGSDVPYAKTHNEGMRLGIIQHVKQFTRNHTYAGIASRFKVMQDTGDKEEFATGAAMSLKTRKAIKNKKVQAQTIVKAHTRRVNQDIPARPFLADSPYLQQLLQRNISLEILKAIKQ